MSMVWICELEVPAPHPVRISSRCSHMCLCALGRISAKEKHGLYRQLGRLDCWNERDDEKGHVQQEERGVYCWKPSGEDVKVGRGEGRLGGEMARDRRRTSPDSTGKTPVRKSSLSTVPIATESRDKVTGSGRFKLTFQRAVSEEWWEHPPEQ